jgi:hypothetical protein
MRLVPYSNLTIPRTCLIECERFRSRQIDARLQVFADRCGACGYLDKTTCFVIIVLIGLRSLTATYVLGEGRLQGLREPG